MTDKINPQKRITIFDTTLRDGDQASGFHLFREEKIEIAKQLSKLGVDVIEAGFPASSQGDYDSVSEISKIIGTPEGPVICALSRAIDSDIEKAATAISSAYKKRIHTFIATSDIHIEDKFKKSRDWVIEQAISAVKKAREYVEDVEFSCEDFGRSDSDYTVDVVSAAILSGASTINLPDTVGWLTPSESYEKVKYVIETVRKRGLDAIFSVHNHNDFGMATATTIEAIRAGARQVEATINGIGERAGNTSLEEIVAIIKTRKLGECNVRTEHIGETSRLLSRITDIYPQPNKAIVGKNAFSHEAGIHQDGMIKGRETYETMNPSEFGVESVLTFGPRSGRNALREKYKQLKISINDNEFDEIVERFKGLADRKKEVDDSDLILAIKNEKQIPVYYKLVSYNPVHVNGNFVSIVELESLGKRERIYEEGDGQIDSAIRGVRKLTRKEELQLTDFNSRSIGRGSDAIGETRINVTKNGWEVKGYSQNSDVVRSAIESFVDAVNRMKYIEDYFNKGSL
ncbi:2-isopropylmalate synthase [uncultured archaeon]|nr:2-isopropylmalate synthase [uncultured archaeon]